MKKITIKSLLALVGFFAFFSANAQLQKTKQFQPKQLQLTADSQESLAKTGFVRCASVEMDALRKQREGITTTTQQFEDWLAPLMQARKAEIAAQKAAGTFKVMAAVEIPIIFHIISAGSGTTNLSAAQIQAQIDQLNIDFNNNAGSTHPAAASAQITFIPALVDPSGTLLAEPGIDRITAYGSGPFPTSDFDVGGGGLEIKSTGWDYAQYANIWTADISGGILGYAQFPSNSTLPGLNANGGTIINNGVVIGSTTVGSIANPNPNGGQYAAGRTLTHEIGHWIGLRHIWGDGNCTVDDFCNDTPNAGAANYNCATGTDSCPADAGTDMVENYMDYSDDTCMNIFTADQVLRIDTVLANADGLSQLPSSTAGQAPAPTIAFATATQTINETTDCGFTDVVMDVTIGKAATADANVTITASGSATVNDYQIIGGNITFPAGTTANQTFTLRVYNDGFVEGNETITLGMTLNANGGDAIITTNALSQNVITITDDNTIPSALTTTVPFTEDGNGALTIVDGDGDGNNWGLVNGLGAWGGITDPAMYSESDLTLLGGIGSTTPDNYIATAQFTIPAGATSIDVSYALAGYTTTEPYELYFTADSSTSATIQAGTLITSGVAAAGDPGGVTTVVMPVALAGQTGKLVMRHVRADSNGSLLIWDTITVTVQEATAVQTAVNSGAATQISLSSTGVIYNSDNTTGDMMADINNTNGVDYGCISTSVSRASGTAQIYQVAGAANFVTDKTFTITPTTVQAAGNATLKFYFTETEIAAWEAATGNNRTALMVIKDNGASQDIAAATIGAFGSEVTLSATFSTGISGTYYFGKSTVLEVKNNDFALFNVYPNPSNGNINIALSSNEDVKVSLFDIRGRKVYGKLHANNVVTFNKTIDFSAMAAGVYMLTIESGAKKATKKLVIQ